jgi:hypothetical protein
MVIRLQFWRLQTVVLTWAVTLILNMKAVQANFVWIYCMFWRVVDKYIGLKRKKQKVKVIILAQLSQVICAINRRVDSMWKYFIIIQIPRCLDERTSYGLWFYVKNYIITQVPRCQDGEISKRLQFEGCLH